VGYNFFMLKTYWPMLALFLTLLTILGVSCYTYPCNECQQDSATQTAFTVGIQNKPNDGSTKANHAERAKFWVKKTVAWPDGVTALLILLTLLGITWQSCEMRKAAEATRISARAAEAQGDHIVVSERAWLVASPEMPDPQIPKITDHTAMAPMMTTVLVKFLNKGETPAFVKKIATGGCAIPREEMPQLNDTSECADVGAIPVVPGHHFSWEHSRIVIERAIKIRSGDLSLWIYGVIVYDDSFGKQRETGFCFRLAPVGELGVGEWLISGQKGANYAT
jgi:hypothetical protein